MIDSLYEIDLVRERKRSRWVRNQQRLAGTTQMWQILSFTGNFDPVYLAELPPPPPQAGELTESQRQRNRLAVEARAKLRLARKYERLRDKLRSGKGAPVPALKRHQEDLLKLYDNGTLLADANRLTHSSGNGRLRRSDESFVDIGGSTGGYARTVLYDWEPPDVTEFEVVEPGDVPQLADTNERTVTIIHEHAETSSSDSM